MIGTTFSYVPIYIHKYNTSYINIHNITITYFYKVSHFILIVKSRDCRNIFEDKFDYTTLHSYVEIIFIYNIYTNMFT